MSRNTIAVAAFLLAMVASFWKAADFLLSHDYRIGALETSYANQETTNAEISNQLKEMNKALVEQTRAIDRLTFEIDRLKEAKP